MGKKSSKTAYVSKGERRCVNKDVSKSLRRDYMGTTARTANQVKAWKQGKRVVLTVPNTGNDNRKHPFIKVLAADLWGDPKAHYRMKDNVSEAST